MAISCEDAEEWKAAISEEIRALTANQTWTVATLPKGAKALSTRWVFKTKTLPCGTTARYKARLVARGFDQRYGIEYTETFAPVVRLESVRLLLAICARFNMERLQFDITTAFLNGKIDEDVFLSPPDGVKCPASMVLKLNKSIYGLKQSPRCWRNRFVEILADCHMHPITSDACIFTGTVLDNVVYLAIHVDDGIAISRSRKALDQLYDNLSKQLNMRIVDTNVFLGMEITKNATDNSLLISQPGYVNKLLKTYNMANCTIDKTLMADRK